MRMMETTRTTDRTSTRNWLDASRYRWFAVHASAILAVAGAACGGEPEATGPTTWTLGAEELRIGSFDDPEESLTDVAHLFVTPWDQVLIAQPDDGMVRVHDAGSGRLIRRLGRTGDGPGEFRVPNWIGLLGDSLWVNDGRLGRVTFFDRDGTHLGDRPYPGRPDVDPPLTVGFGMLTADGGALFVTNSRDGDHSLPVLVVAPDGRQTAIGERSGLPRFSTLSAPDGGWRMQQQRFWTRTTWSPDPQGRSVVFGEREAPDTPGEATYRVSRVSITGDTLFSRQVPYDPIPIPQTVLDSLPENTPEAYVPRYYPPVSAVVAGRDGTTWVARETTPSDTRRWDVFDASGEHIGALDAPADLEIHDATAERIWAVTFDELDVPYVVRLPVRTARRPAP